MTDKCAKCSSSKIVPQAKVIDHGDYNATLELTVAVEQNPDAYIFKERVSSSVFAKICGECGFLEFYANEPKSLWDAHENKPPF